MSVTCGRCGATWPRDPALGVACPTCYAAAGSPCKRPSGHGCAVHAERDQRALDRGLLQPCPGRPPAPAAAVTQPTLLTVA